MIYKSERSQKTVLFSKLLQVFKSRASRIAGFHDTLHNHDKFSPFYICTNLIIAAESGLPKVPASRSLEYSTMPPGSQCRSFIRLRARFMKIYTLPLQGSCPMASVMIPLRVWKLLHISVGRLYNR